MMIRRLLKSNGNKRDKDKVGKSTKSGRPNTPKDLASGSYAALRQRANTTVGMLDVDFIDDSTDDERSVRKRAGRGSTSQYRPNNHDSSISVKQLHSQFVTKHADEDLLFRSEFERIKIYIESVTVRCECARKPENMPKNRYKNVVTSDRGRVKLSQINKEPHSDYINATYIDGYDYQRKFIAAQGPKENTVDDFWRMIWEQRCYVIVMITQLHETGRKKCELYWPETAGESCRYGRVEVRNDSTFTHGTFLKRTLTVRHLDMQEDEEGGSRVVSHFQFLVWPDHGVPKSTSDIFRFRDRCLEMQPEDGGPILVHCSAGVGRTGTFIGLDVLLHQLHGTARIDPLTLVTNFRLRRTHMVQSLEQYVLLHKLLDEWRTLGRTEFTINNFAEKYENLVSTGGIESEFKRVVTCLPLNTRPGRGLFEQNRVKNRSEKIIPYEHSQINIRMWPSEQIPAYYNASPIQTYQQDLSLIAAQGPMKNTCEDFWRLVLDNNVRVIIMLNSLDSNYPDVDYQYWPLETKKTMNMDENISVKNSGLCSKHGVHDITVTKLTVKNTRLDPGTSVDVTHIHYTGWGSSADGDNSIGDHFCRDMLRTRRILLSEIRSLANADAYKPRVLVHCTNGCGRTGVFCSLINSLAYIENEKLVDVMRSVKDLRDNRPHMVQTLKQYRLCYDVVLRHIDEVNSTPSYEQTDSYSDAYDDCNGGVDEEEEETSSLEANGDEIGELRPNFDDIDLMQEILDHTKHTTTSTLQPPPPPIPLLLQTVSSFEEQEEDEEDEEQEEKDEEEEEVTAAATHEELSSNQTPDDAQPVGQHLDLQQAQDESTPQEVVAVSSDEVDDATVLPSDVTHDVPTREDSPDVASISKESAASLALFVEEDSAENGEWAEVADKDPSSNSSNDALDVESLTGNEPIVVAAISENDEAPDDTASHESDETCADDGHDEEETVLNDEPSQEEDAS